MAVLLNTLKDKTDPQTYIVKNSGANGNNTTYTSKQVDDGWEKYVKKDQPADQPKNPVDTGGGGNGAGGGGGTGGGTVSYSSGSALNGVDGNTYNKMTSEFQASQAYTDAMNYTNSLLQQLSSGRTSYTDQLKDMMDQIMNRDKFSYDVDKDVLFQQYLQSMQNTGRSAMQDTMGQAAALTGGYGSSYATTAGNQAYNAYIQQAYDNLPEYYNSALNAYNTETENLFNQYGLLSDADQQEYSRLYNAYTANYNNANDMYNREYGAWSDSVSNAFNLANMQNSDYWNQQDMNYKYSSLAQSQKQWEAEMQYKKDQAAIANDQWQKEYELDLAKQSASQSGVDEEKYASDMEKALEIYNTKGEAAYQAYVENLNYDAALKDKISFYIEDYGYLPLEQRTWTKTGDGYYKDQYGQTYHADQLPSDMQTLLKNFEVGKTYNLHRQ